MSHHHLIVYRIALVLPMLQLASVQILIMLWKELGGLVWWGAVFHEQLEE
jgi:hypothetical protein